MTDNDPFAGWSEEYKASQAIATAELLKHFGAKEHLAARHLSEANTYYASRLWKAEGIEAEQLDRLLNDLRQQADAARSILHQTSDRLNAILQSQRSFKAAGSITQRREDLLRTAKPLHDESALDPSPLEAFLQAKRAPSAGRRKKQSLSL